MAFETAKKMADAAGKLAQKVGRFGVEAGEKIIGRGSRVEARNRIRKELEDILNSYTPPKKEADPEDVREAESFVLDDAFSQLCIDPHGHPPPADLQKDESPAEYRARKLKSIEATVSEIYSSEQIEFIQSLSSDAERIPPIPTGRRTPYRLEYASQGTYFDDKYKSRPANIVLSERATQILKAGEYAKKTRVSTMAVNTSKTFSENLERMRSRGLRPREKKSFGNLGQILLFINEMKRHENEFDKEVKFQNSIETLKTDAKEIFTVNGVEPFVRFMTSVGDIFKGALDSKGAPALETVVKTSAKAAGEFITTVANWVYGTGKLGVKTTGTLARYIQKVGAKSK